MKRKLKHTSKLYEYLERTNALSGTDAEIQAAKRAYRKQYQAEWRKRKRAANREIAVALSLNELRTIALAARKHRLSRSQFLKLAALSYINYTFVVPDILTVNTILESVAMTYSGVQKLFDESRISYEIGKELLAKISAMEKSVQSALLHPERIEDRLKEEIRKNPALIETVSAVLKAFQP